VETGGGCLFVRRATTPVTLSTNIVGHLYAISFAHDYLHGILSADRGKNVMEKVVCRIVFVYYPSFAVSL
jgi:hypothetical protein